MTATKRWTPRVADPRWVVEDPTGVSFTDRLPRGIGVCWVIIAITQPGTSRASVGCGRR